MDAYQFALYINRLHPLQRLNIRFTKKGMNGMFRLRAVTESNSAVVLDQPSKSKAVMAAIELSRDWCGDQNRSYYVFGLQYADRAMLDAIAKDVESISVDEHVAKGLISNRQNLQDKMAEHLIKSVLTPVFLAEVSGWGCSIMGTWTKFETIPCIEFMLRLSRQKWISFIIDGWSGRMAINGTFGNELYVSHEQIQDTIRKVMEEKLEEMTAA